MLEYKKVIMYNCINEVMWLSIVLVTRSYSHSYIIERFYLFIIVSDTATS